MRIAVDAHAIGRRLTGNEVFIRSLLQAFAAQPDGCDFCAYVSSEEAAAAIPRNISCPPCRRQSLLPSRVGPGA